MYIFRLIYKNQIAILFLNGRQEILNIKIEKDIEEATANCLLCHSRLWEISTNIWQPYGTR